MANLETSAEGKLSALDSVLNSKEFSGAERLKSFLTYVVEQDLAGRGDAILGKTILEDVYKKELALDSNPETVVRVDATRLRQRLELYYGGEGRHDPIRIHIDKGGYSPRFETVAPGDEHDGDVRRRLHPVAYVIGVAVIGVAIFGGASTLLKQDNVTPTLENISPEARSALFENAPTTLMARNMSREARELLFPAAQLTRVSAALEMFEEAIRLDPNFFGGYAGASQAATILAGLSPEPAQRVAYLQTAQTYAKQALELDSTKAWSHSAAAFAQFVGGSFELATKSSQTALELEPYNRYSLVIDAIIAVFEGDFERVLKSADPQLHREGPDAGLPWRIALGNAYFHLGEYDNSILFLTEAVRVGDPVSEINTAHLIASYQASGQTEKAAEMVAAFNASWPDSRVSGVMQRLFLDPENARNVLAQMRAAGWQDTAAE